MADTYRILISGIPLPGRPRDEVTRALATLMRLSEAGAASLLGGSETVVKRGLAADQVARYVAAIEKTGAAVRAEAEPAAVALEPPPPSPPATPVPAAPAPLALVGETMKCPACGAEQPKRTLCRECGVDMPRMLAAQEEALRQPPVPEASPYAAPRSVVRDSPRLDHDSETPAAMSFSFSGRIGRLRYLAYSLPAYLPIVVAAVIGGGLAGLTRNPAAMLVPIGIAALVTAWLALRVVVLRLHDLNRSGWTTAVFLLPVAVALSGSSVAFMVSVGVVGLLALALTFWPGADEANDYGPPPGPNTLWTVVGAVTVILLSVAGSLSGGGRLAANQAFGTPPAEASD